MENMKEFDRAVAEAKVKNFGRSVKEKAKKAFDWVVENKEVSIPLIGIAVGGACKISHEVNRSKTIRNEEKVRNEKVYRTYDPSLGDYYNLRRPMTTSEKLEVDRRVRGGERKGQVLSELGLLKY